MRDPNAQAEAKPLAPASRLRYRAQVPSIIARIVKLGSRAQVKRRPRTAEALVEHLRKALSRAPYPTRLPAGVRLQTFEHGGLFFDHLSVRAPREAVLYLHGGGYIAGHARVYHNLAGMLATELEADVFLPHYRLAPEHPFPAALNDALSAYETLIARGFSPQCITLAGDSAGGGLALACLLALRDRGLPLPKCATVFSPLTDLTMSAASIEAFGDIDDMFTPELIYAGKGLYARIDQARHPHASPAFGDFTGLPPLFMTVCERECLRDDTYRVLERARAAGVEVQLVARADMLHVWPIFAPLMPEARDDVRKAVAFIKRQAV